MRIGERHTALWGVLRWTGTGSDLGGGSILSLAADVHAFSFDGACFDHSVLGFRNFFGCSPKVATRVRHSKSHFRRGSGAHCVAPSRTFAAIRSVETGGLPPALSSSSRASRLTCNAGGPVPLAWWIEHGPTNARGWNAPADQTGSTDATRPRRSECGGRRAGRIARFGS